MQSRKIIFDITSLVGFLVYNNHYTGIQRVVVMILDEFIKLKIKNVWICFFHPSSNQYLALELDSVNFNNWSDPSKAREFLRAFGIIGSNKVLDRYKKNIVKYYFHRLRFDFAALMRNDKMFVRKGLTIAEWKKTRERIKESSQLKILADIVELEDQVILLDATWKQDYIEEYKRMKSKGVEIYTLVYDLIPVLYPKITVPGISPVFYSWLIQSISYTTCYITISANTKKDLFNFLQTHTHSCETRIETIPLVQINVPTNKSFDLYKKENSLNLPDLLNSITNVTQSCKNILCEPFVLHVGTIEIRKNTWRLALAWKKLLDQGYYDLPRLVIVGKLGWLNDHFWDLMRGTGNLYGYVTTISDISDTDLDLLYKNCLFSAMVSMYEGWGLPIGETLSYGKTAVVANNSSLPEVGMDLVEYCDALSVASIAASVKKLVFEPNYRENLEAKIKQTKLRNWSDVAYDLENILKTQF
ncbi:hypothetical protein BGI37_08020 [Snodgrassella alvi]|jgi:glycosyltransferase involved in cell wall biosynthesis|nr:hypothetical protein BGI37_08020 [Snodgrassella alvi]